MIAQIFQADLSNPDETVKLFEEETRVYGRIDTIVNNAGGRDAQRTAHPKAEAFNTILPSYFYRFPVRYMYRPKYPDCRVSP